MFKEFKEFAMKGNVIDMAVGIIIGGAFGKIVSSLVADIIMPPIGALLGNINFTNLFITLAGSKQATLEAAKVAGATTLNIGVFINTIIDFVIIAFSIFLVIRWMNKIKRKMEKEPVEAPKPAKPSAEVELLTEIRDLLKR